MILVGFVRGRCLRGLEPTGRPRNFAFPINGSPAQSPLPRLDVCEQAGNPPGDGDAPSALGQPWTTPAGTEWLLVPHGTLLPGVLQPPAKTGARPAASSPPSLRVYIDPPERGELWEEGEILLSSPAAADQGIKRQMTGNEGFKNRHF